MTDASVTHKEEMSVETLVAFKCSNLVITDLPRKDEEVGLAYSKTFHVAYTDLDTSTVHTGEFTCARLTIGATIDLGAIKLRLMSGMHLSPEFAVLASWAAYLDVALTKKPDWWNPVTSYDMDALHALHDYVRVWEESFRTKRLAKRRSEAPSGSSAPP